MYGSSDGVFNTIPIISTQVSNGKESSFHAYEEKNLALCETK